jgi:TP901 family phage tail tape measure protein
LAQTLETIIAINARTGSGFSEVGATLTELGSLVDGLSQELIEFGEDSVQVYRDYEKSMKDAEVALSTTYGRSTKELSTVMTQLDASATEWAATSIFHTNDVANAISEAAHAGWDYNQIMSGIPAAMQLAQAGSLDLSEAVNYIVKATNAAGVEFEDMSNFIDLWAFAANSSASTIGEFGEAMLKMGSTMRFAGDTEELMTLIAVTANAGTTGSEAGTMIRNSMMRLIAPTDKAKEVMAELGATSEETASILEDESLAAANAELAEHGFSAYDTEGNLKSTLDIYRELYLALGDIAGGFDNIDKNEDALQTLAAIFPTRTITEALTLLRGAADGYDGLYEAMKGGDAEGYGEYAAETMMDSLDGKIETFESKVERLKQLVGEELSGQLEDALGGLGDIVDSISNLDEGTFSALVSGAEVLAAAGPALLTAGAAFRIIGTALTPAGAIGLGLVTLTSLVAGVEKLEEADFEGGFGLAEMDYDTISSYVQGLGTSFGEAFTEIDKFRQAVDQSVTSYETASQTFSSNLLTDMLTGVQLSDEDKANLESLGDEMHQAVISGIQNSTAASMSYFEMLFGGAGTAEENDEYRDIIDLTNSSYEESIAQAESIGQQIREALTSAFSDGTISPEEYQNILSFMQSYNDAIAKASAEAQSEQDYIDQQMLLHKAQTASLDEIESMSAEITSQKEQTLQEAEDNYLRERYGLEYRYDQAIANGTEINGTTATEEGKAAALAAVDAQYNQQKTTQSEKYDDILYSLWDSQIRQSDYADQYEELRGLANRVLSGELTPDSAIDMFEGEYGTNKWAGETDLGSNNIRTRLGELLARQIAAQGGYDEIEAKIADYDAKGDTESANQLRQLYAMDQINNEYARTGVKDWNGIASSILGDDTVVSMEGAQKSSFLETLNNSISDYTVENAKATVAAFTDEESNLKSFFDTVGKEASGQNSGIELFQSKMNLTKNDANELMNIVQKLSQSYDLEKVLTDTAGGTPFEDTENALRDVYAAYSLMFGEASQNPEQYRIQVTPEIDQNASLELDPIPVPIEPYVEGQDSMTALQDQGVQVQVEGDTQQLQATIDGADGQNLLEYIDGDATDLTMKITDQDGKTLVENVTGNTSSLAAVINSYNGRTITVNIAGNRLFAEGGRATTASIFGEAGPEWAIPEEHSQRTADLLNSARAASGFSWPELLSMYGGLNAGSGNGSTTLVYSPTINAQDVTGVESALQEDKKRLDKWFEEKQMRDNVEVYQ